MEPVNNDGMCRCCASEGTFKDLQSTYLWMGIGEVYSDMIKDCFDISLSTSISGNGGICEVCITQLRNACNFKKQVEQTEEQFRRRLADSEFRADVVKIEVPPDVEGHDADNDPFEGTVSGEFSRPANVLKIEVPPDDEDHDADNDPFEGTMSDEFSGPEYDIPLKNIKIEKEIEKPKKRAAKPSTSKAKKPKAEDGEPSVKRDGPETQFIEIELIKQEPPSDSEMAEDDMASYPTVTRIKIEPIPQSEALARKLKKEAKRRSRKETLQEMKKHLRNITTILLSTNATPIRYHDGQGYVCALCPEQYPQPSDLKIHALLEHDKIDKSTFMEGHRYLAAYVVKLDITDLKCLLCGSEIDGLEPLIEHLQVTHGKQMHTDMPNHILPFRFVGNGFDCVLCPKSFEHFKHVQEHMNVHYRNHTCQTCNAPFVNRRALQNHALRHKQGEFACDHCPKVFDTKTKKLNHEKFVHAGDYKRNKCQICQEKFSSYAKKREHMALAHGAEPQIIKCKDCNKTFATRARLKGHMKKYHLNCKYPCGGCDKRFYTKMELSKHMVKHSPVKMFTCDLCSKTYAWKNTLREHMKMHANIRDYKCNHCDAAFVRKRTWLTHLRNIHKIIHQ